MTLKTFLLVCLAILFQQIYSYPQHVIDEAINRRDQWWQSQEDKRLQAKKAEAIRIINQPQHKPPLQATASQDKMALEAMYSATNGAQWANNSGWMKGDPCQDYWYGIYCSESGRVLQINLVYNLLSGSLPVDMARLDQLQVLRLYSNNIGGTMPAGLFSLNSIEIIDVDNNQIGGTLPGTISMANVTTLNLYANNFGGTIPTVWNTPNLQVLSLSSNHFEGPLPTSLSRVTTLEELVVSRNTLTGDFPSEYGQLTNLQQLWLFSNNFDHPRIPESWSQMTKLTSVEIDGLYGDFPDFIGTSWSQVEYLLLVNGYMTGQFPTSLCNLKKVQFLGLYNNSLKGDLPSCICNLPQSLQYFELSDNQITGPIPDCIGNLTGIVNLYFSRNNISGSLPRSIGNLKHMEILDVSNNGIYGTIPSTFANLIGTTVQLGVCYNKLSTIEDGLEQFFDFIKGYSCLLYNNPWSCPLPSFVPKDCQATCSDCNSGSTHASCTACINNSDCGWCNEGGNCLEGSASGPGDYYRCEMSDWSYGSQAHCPS